MKKKNELEAENLAFNIQEKKDSVEDERLQEINGCEAAICYIGEFIFYPAIMLLLYLIYFCITGVFLIIIGTILAISIPFLPFTILSCLCGEKGKAFGSFMCGISVLSILMIFSGMLSIAFSPLIAIWEFFYVYYIIFSERISPYHTLPWNFQRMTILISQSQNFSLRYYHHHKKTFKYEKNISN